VVVVVSLSQGRTAAAQCGLFTHKSVPVIFEPPCKTDRLSRNVSKKLPLHAAECRIREQISVSTHAHSVAQCG